MTARSGAPLLRLGLVVVLVVGASGPGFSQRDTSPDAATWNRRPPGVGDYRTVTEVSGRAELARFRIPSDPRSLRSVCDARQEALAAAVPTLEQHLAALLARAPADQSLAEITWDHHDLGQLWAYQGRMDKAIPEMEAAWRAVTANADRSPGLAAAEPYLETVLGVLHLRRGELENCVHDKNADRCLFPIRASGVHTQTSGSETAIEYFTRHLRRSPDDLEARWLLNVATMTLGRFPDGVPKDQLIPPEAWASPDDPGRFPDVAPRLGLDAPGRAGGVVADDIDGDGLFDVVISSVDPCAPLRYYHNEGNGTFRDRTVEAGLADQLGGINLVQTDYDNDGRLDLMVLRGGWELPMRNSLLHQNPDGTFTDVTEKAGLALSIHRTHSAAWADFDGDGWLDVFVAHEESKAALFKNQGDGTFVDVAHAAGVDRVSFAKGATWGDYDNDGRPDLYVSNFGEENFLYHNQGDGTFKEVAKELGVEKPVMSFPTWFFDYDNDGWLDLFVASFVPSVTEVARGFLHLPPQAETMRLYRNTGGRFQDVTQAAGLDRVVPTMGANFGDLDEDGFLDFYLGTGAPSYAALMPNVMFRNQEGRRFTDVTTATGTGHLQKGHGVAFVDLDDDGDQDVYANIGGFVPGDAYNKVVFENPGHGRHSIRLHLVGTRSNRAAIGARIKLTVAGPDGVPREIHRQVSSGGSFGCSPLAQQVGLGSAREVRTLEVLWPASATRQVLRNVRADQVVEIREGSSTYTVSPLRKARVGGR